MRAFMAVLLSLSILNVPELSQTLVESDREQGISDFVQQKKLKEAGYDTFDLSTLKRFPSGFEATALAVDAESLQRHKRDLSDDEATISLTLTSHGEHFHFNLRHVPSVLHPEAAILYGNPDNPQTWTGNHPDCFLRGQVTSHGGSVSLSFCDKVDGVFITDQYTYKLETLPSTLVHRPKHNEESEVLDILVARRRLYPVTKVPHASLMKDYETAPEASEQSVNTSPSRRARTPAVTIETAIWMDEKMNQYLEDIGAKSLEGKIYRMVMKWSGVQAEWSRAKLGYDITIQIKMMTFWTTDPHDYVWYSANKTVSIGIGNQNFCKVVGRLYPSFDHLHMHTGVTNKIYDGFAYTGANCREGYKCATTGEREPSEFYITAHELGHTMGMRHDDVAGCNSNDDKGIMGQFFYDWSNCSVRDLQKYLVSSTASCLYDETVNITTVPEYLKNSSMSLPPAWPGLIYTNDEICAANYGSGYRYRPFPYWNTCDMWSCINTNPGPLYGTMVNDPSTVFGRFCGDEKVCFMNYITNHCGSWNETELPPESFTVVEGGWGQWGYWSPCSRTCGGGVFIRTRSCDNPKPLLSSGCVGSEVDVLSCNTAPCTNDSTDSSDLIKERAAETCSRLVSAGVLNGSNYDGTGDKFYYQSHGQCEVKCNGIDIPLNKRFGLMPDGTPCNSDASYNDADVNGYPRKTGLYGTCVQGYCYTFDCEHKTSGNKTLDSCGVCGGDNSTCNMFEGVYTGYVGRGNRTTISLLPVGSFDIQYYFKWSQAKQVFIEVWSEQYNPLLASYMTLDWDTEKTFAGTTWKFVFHAQYLTAKGPTSEPVIIQLYQHRDNPNVGVNYGYSTDCNATCQNGGTWRKSSCSCDCQTGYHGTFCEVPCFKTCLNGGIMDFTVCGCLCANPRTTGGVCHCQDIYTGDNCTECKYSTCHNNGTLISDTCRCECGQGYSGLQCEECISEECQTLSTSTEGTSPLTSTSTVTTTKLMSTPIKSTTLTTTPVTSLPTTMSTTTTTRPTSTPIKSTTSTAIPLTSIPTTTSTVTITGPTSTPMKSTTPTTTVASSTTFTPRPGEEADVLVPVLIAVGAVAGVAVIIIVVLIYLIRSGAFKTADRSNKIRTDEDLVDFPDRIGTDRGYEESSNIDEKVDLTRNGSLEVYPTNGSIPQEKTANENDISISVEPEDTYETYL